MMTLIRLLKKEYPEAACALKYKTVFQLLVATQLSAQCTDDRVNQVTKELFKQYKTVQDFANADIAHLEQMIHSTGFYKNKARNIKKCSQKLVKYFHGKVPKDIDDLVSLDGIGRKTANVVLGVGYGITSGVVVDTHVKRIARLLGITCEKDPVKIEKNLCQVLPKKHWIEWTHLIIAHGRAVCIARRPQCNDCCLNQYCQYYLTTNLKS